MMLLTKQHCYGTCYYCIRPLLTTRCYWKDVFIKTLISQTLLFDIVKILPDEYVYPCPVCSLHIIFLFLYTTPANSTSFYIWFFLPRVFRITSLLMRNLPIKNIFSIMVTDLSYVLLMKLLFRIRRKKILMLYLLKTGVPFVNPTLIIWHTY